MAGFDPNAVPPAGSGYGNKTVVVPNTGPKPIGVPKGYQAGKVVPEDFGTALFAPPGQYHGGQTYKVSPNYYAGDEYGSVPGFPTEPQDIATLQQYLVQAGLLDDKKVVYGQWDATSAKAFSSILGSANQQGADWQDTLAQRMTLADQQGLLQRGSSASASQRQITLTNPEDLKATAQNVAQNLYGGNLPEEDLQKFVSAYQSMQSGYQTSTDGTVTQPPSVDTAAEAQIRADHPDQVAATQFGARMKDIIGTFTGGFNG